MALDGKTIIKEEITDKEVYEASTTENNTSTSNTHSKVNSNSRCSSKDSSCSSNSPTSGSQHNNNNNNNSNSSHTNPNSCRTPPDSPPESARAVAPHSPMSPQLHHSIASGLAPPPLPTRPNRNASASPVINGATTTPPPPPQAVVAAVAAAHVEQARLLSKIRKFFGSLVQLTQDVHPEVSERVRALILSLCSGGITIEEFRLALQEIIQLPLRSYVVPLLKNHVALLQREIVALARASNQTTLQYVTSNENTVMEFTPHGPTTEYTDIFVQLENIVTPTGNPSTNTSSTSLVFKRRSSDTLLEQHNGVNNGNIGGSVVSQDWTDYLSAASYPPPKRLLSHIGSGYATTQSTLFDYSTSTVNVSTGANSSTQNNENFNSLIEKPLNQREREEREREMRSNEVLVVGTQRHSSASVCSTAPIIRNSAVTSGDRSNGITNNSGQEEEWKNIHTMLNCISAMVDKTKRAITILQQRGVSETTPSHADLTPAALHEMRRQTEEKVAEFKRNAEEAVNQVKRQAVIEIQRAVVAAESRASEVMAQERLRMEKFFIDISRHSNNGNSSTANTDREIENKSPLTSSATTAITSGQNTCWNCGRKATETCSGCNLARYCGAFCQHKDWEHHHQICGTSRNADLNVSNKHVAAVATAASVSQVLPLTTNVRGPHVKSPSISTSQQQISNGTGALITQSSGGGIVDGGSTTCNQLVINGIGSK